MRLRDGGRVGLVAAGGAAGTLLRWGIDAGTDAGAFLPVIVVNVVGSGLLGYLVGRVPVRDARSEAFRLAVGTGLLGGFTTFSAFAVDAARTADDRPLRALAYVLVTVLGSCAAAVAGISAGAMAAPPDAPLDAPPEDRP